MQMKSKLSLAKALALFALGFLPPNAFAAFRCAHPFN
jgi:hypothetical protein